MNPSYPILNSLWSASQMNAYRVNVYQWGMAFALGMGCSLIGTSQGQAKTLPVTPALNPAITQAIAAANPDLAVPIMATNQPSSEQGGASISPAIIESDGNGSDDGGEITIADGYVPIDGLPNTTLTITTVPATDNPPLSDANPVSDTNPISQVPLGAVSPETVAKFVKMVDLIRKDYVKPVDDEDLFKNAMTGTLTGLDPYSEYLDEAAFNNLKLFTEGDIGSIGVKVTYQPSTSAWVFEEVLPNSPAARQGVQRGNYLHQINDNKLDEPRTQADVDQLLLGIAGTQVKLVVSDRGRRKRTVSVQRTLLQQQTLDIRLIAGIAIVSIPVFQNNTQQQLMSALARLDQPFSMIVLDLRNNPGGVLSAANDVASLFMNNQAVAQIKNRQGLQEVIRTYGKPRFANVPLAIVQNRYSASAAEVLASSLQENGRAKIYGETSYGKGSIQSILPLNDNEAIKLTVAHYYSGKGKIIDGVGVRPDYPLIGSQTDWENQILEDLQKTPRPASYRLEPNNLGQSF